MKQPAVYILASRMNGTLYIGVTSDLVRRVREHKNDLVEGFTQRYGVHRLVWYELHETMEAAILQEKRLKKWRRAWKLRLIRRINPEWEDLYDRLIRPGKEWAPASAGATVLPLLCVWGKLWNVRTGNGNPQVSAYAPNPHSQKLLKYGLVALVVAAQHH